jgi:hypothetical protein
VHGPMTHGASGPSEGCEDSKSYEVRTSKRRLR